MEVFITLSWSNYCKLIVVRTISAGAGANGLDEEAIFHLIQVSDVTRPTSQLKES